MPGSSSIWRSRVFDKAAAWFSRQVVDFIFSGVQNFESYFCCHCVLGGLGSSLRFYLASSVIRAPLLEQVMTLLSKHYK